ncbi:MAG TPA: histidine--tRNA ligase [Oligoflexus sp.]|uniref:histidine--tRNA ligase n=1 Tax=Oligoflexus sp. TaxID=1971216 RepID=UPI002D7F0319|nr:histidine--tRNA ligase [Oligoflexus sp.]HET9235842.1 histidine--tRNA ligase [Oligoflexus sp.]
MSTQERITPRKLKGFRDYLPQQASLRKRIQDRIYQKAFQAGFLPIDTPVLEYAETLLGTGGTDTDKEVYRFEDHGERMVALRFDLTVPFARFVAENYSELVFPFKKVQIGNSWRGEKPQKGRYREFCQADLDIIGVDSLAADVEVLSCIMSNLVELVPGAFTMAIGHRIILSALIKACLPQLVAGGENRTLIALDKLAKIGEPAVKDLILQIEGSEASGADRLLKVLQGRDASGQTDLNPVKELLAGTPALQEIKRLEETAGLLQKLYQNTKAKVRVDLSIARGLGYYTGIVFETTIDGLDGFGSISSGGRYNGLVSRFSTQELAGVGGSIGVDRLLAALEQLGLADDKTRRGVFIALAGEEGRSYGFQLLAELRAAGVLADIALKEGKLGNQFKFADKRQYQYVLTLGGDEVASKTVSIKDLASGQERKSVPWVDAFTELSQLS